MTIVAQRDEMPGRGVDLHPLYLLAVAIIDAAVIMAGAAGILAIPILLTMHLALAGAVCFVRGSDGDNGVAAIGAISVLAMGPLGALGMIMLAHRLRHDCSSADSLAPSHHPSAEPAHLDPPHAIYNEVAEGRAYSAERSQVLRFAEVIAGNSVREKQALLGTISKQYHPDYLPFLQVALRSQEAQVRVSAAAVYAKLREGFSRPIQKRQAKTTPQTKSLHGREALEQAQALADAARSGLLSISDAYRARSIALSILVQERPAAVDLDETETLLCGLLLEMERYDEIEARLAPLIPKLGGSLRDILFNARLRGGLSERIPFLLKSGQSEVVSFDRSRAAASKLPLLAPFGDDTCRQPAVLSQADRGQDEHSRF
ncbi:hypothetical protein [Chelativorans sp. Marseille-P2723]|uniref:hypothetical protein n=1 Tax=Chelativorans sp. Marseille-P2723 TaxID=2709133 RepID=UPI00156DE60E|nr:hypothetical protein [Chelativorans sp. Marseille-P2723]